MLFFGFFCKLWCRETTVISLSLWSYRFLLFIRRPAWTVANLSFPRLLCGIISDAQIYCLIPNMSDELIKDGIDSVAHAHEETPLRHSPFRRSHKIRRGKNKLDFLLGLSSGQSVWREKKWRSWCRAPSQMNGSVTLEFKWERKVFWRVKYDFLEKWKSVK